MKGEVASHRKMINWCCFYSDKSKMKLQEEENFNSYLQEETFFQ